MIATFCSLIIAGYLVFQHISDVPYDWIMGIALILLTATLTIVSQVLTFNVRDTYFKEDPYLQMMRRGIFLIPLLGIWINFELMFLDHFTTANLIGAHIFLLGVSIDLFFNISDTLACYLSDYGIVTRLGVLKKNQDLVAEIALRAASNNQIALVKEALKSLYEIIRSNVNDKAALMQYFAHLHASANASTRPTIITYLAALATEEEGTLCIREIAKIAKDESLEYAICALQKLADEIEPNQTLISVMHDLSLRLYQYDKSIEIRLLKHPFEALKNKYNSPTLLASINDSLDQFQAIEELKNTLPL